VRNPFNFAKSGIQTLNGDQYSSYVLKLTCDLRTSVSVMIGSGCCLKSENKGGICIAYGEDYYYYTYAITEEDFSQLTSGTYEIPEQSKLI